jgi:hypothetical protein
MSRIERSFAAMMDGWMDGWMFLFSLGQADAYVEPRGCHTADRLGVSVLGRPVTLSSIEKG